MSQIYNSQGIESMHERIQKLKEMQIFNEEYKLKTLCGNQECANSPTKHRHSTEKCLQHLFCLEEPMIPIDGDHTKMPEKMPQTSLDFDRSRRDALFPDEKNGQYVGFDDFINQYGKNIDYLSKEQPIPDDRKLIMTDEAIGTWLAAHFGLKIDQIPYKKHPQFQNQWIYDYLRKMRYGNSRIKSDFRKKKSQSITTPIQFERKRTQIVKTPEILYRFPKDFQCFTYAKTLKVLSVVGIEHQKSLNNKKRQRFCKQHSKIIQDSSTNIKNQDLNQADQSQRQNQDVHTSNKNSKKDKEKEHIGVSQKDRFKDFEYLKQRKNNLYQIMEPLEIEDAVKRIMQNNLDKQNIQQDKKQLLKIENINEIEKQKQIEIPKKIKKDRLASGNEKNKISDLNSSQKIIKTEFERTFVSPQYQSTKNLELKQSNFTFQHFEKRVFKKNNSRYNSFQNLKQPKNQDSFSQNNRNEILKKKEISRGSILQHRLDSKKSQQEILKISQDDIKKQEYQNALQPKVLISQIQNNKLNLPIQPFFTQQFNDKSKYILISEDQSRISSNQENSKRQSLSLFSSKKKIPINIQNLDNLDFKSANILDDINLEETNSNNEIPSIQKNLIELKSIMKLRKSIKPKHRNESISSFGAVQESKKLQQILNSQYNYQFKQMELPAEFKYLDKSSVFKDASSAADKFLQKNMSSLTEYQKTHRTEKMNVKFNPRKSSLNQSTAYTEHSKKIINQNLSPQSSQKPSAFNKNKTQNPIFIKDDQSELKSISTNKMSSEINQNQNENQIESFIDPKLIEQEKLNLSQKILKELNQLILNLQNDQLHKVQYKYEIDIEIKMIQQSIKDLKSTYYRNFKKQGFWLQKATLQMKFANDWETAIDYIASGIKELPLKFDLLYNYACLSEKLGRIEIAIRFFEISMEVRPRWVDSLFALAIIYYKLGDLKNCERKIGIAISNYKNNSFYQFEQLLYLSSLCSKFQGNLKKTMRDYGAVYQMVKQKEGMHFMDQKIGIILIPMEQNRIIQTQYLDNSQKLIQHFETFKKVEKNKQLKSFCQHNSNYFDLKNFGIQALNAMYSLPFFDRLDRDDLKKFLPHFRIEYFEMDEIVFLEKRIGIISFGSVRLIDHSKNVLNPFVIGRYKKGRILDQNQLGQNISQQIQTWILAHDQLTEIVFMENQIFDQIVTLLKIKQKEYFLLNKFLQYNKIWNKINFFSQMHLLYENLTIRVFRPGQLVCRCNKKSILARQLFSEFYKFNYNKMAADLDKEIYKERMSNLEKKIQERDNQTPGSPSGITKTVSATSNYLQMIVSKKESNFQSLEFDSIEGVLQTFKDQEYQEVDGVYIVYHGKVDILNPYTLELVYQIGVNDHFGDSVIFNSTGKEDLGDMYACLYPSKKKNQNDQEFNEVILQDQMKLKDFFKMQEDMEEKVSFEKAVNQNDDCVVCLYLPYKSLYDVIPMNEYKLIKDALLRDENRKILITQVANKYSLEANDFLYSKF